MKEQYEIVYVEKPGEAEWNVIGPGISQYNTQCAGDTNYQSLCFVVRTPDQEIVGGLIGSTYWNWLYIDLLWVKEEFRSLGYGGRLLSLTEQKARNRGAKNAYLDTFSFQAPDFYKKYGYRVFGQLDDFPAGHQRYFFTKEL